MRGVQPEIAWSAEADFESGIRGFIGLSALAVAAGMYAALAASGRGGIHVPTSPSAAPAGPAVAANTAS